jgi:hypothetical protein
VGQVLCHATFAYPDTFHKKFFSFAKLDEAFVFHEIPDSFRDFAEACKKRSMAP